jgi:hypothetical protein
MKKLLFLFSVLLISVSGLPAFAADEKQSEEPPRNEALEAAQDFMKDLDETSQRHFSVLHGNYNLIKVVETVRESVDEAVAACGKANPEMKEALGNRFGEWKEAVRPVMKEADANVENMILAQDYAKPKEIRSFLKMVDKARKKQRDAVERVPVVTPEACQSLLEKMDDTQENMVRLLKATLVSLPQVMQAQDDERRAKVQAEKEKEKAEAEAAAKAEAEAEKENAEKEAEEKGGE